MRHITKRLHPGSDLKKEIVKIIEQNSVKAGVVLSAVGSLEEAVLRMPGAKDFLELHEPLEIVSVTGTISPDGVHVHISVSDDKGKTYGGHLSDGNIIRGTAEIVLLIFDTQTYSRKLDPETGFKELNVE